MLRYLNSLKREHGKNPVQGRELLVRCLNWSYFERNMGSQDSLAGSFCISPQPASKNMAEEKIIKKDQVFVKLMPGFLVLTSKRIYFEYNAGFFKVKLKNLFDIPIENIINVEASKDFISTDYILKIRHTLDGKEYQEKCTKNGWSPFKNKSTFNIEANFFDSWVKAIEEVRSSKHIDSINLSDLEKLAELKDKGILTNEEFEAKKKQILNL